MPRIAQSQQNHDREVCRFASRFAAQPIWSSCPSVANSVAKPPFALGGVDYEPDIFLSNVAPEGGGQPLDWILEVETSETVGIDHTRKQLTAFVDYARRRSTRIFVLVPPQDIATMRTNLAQWGLGSVNVEQWG